MLTRTLRELERDGLVTRTVTASVPVLRSLGQWSEADIEAILTARAGYDTRDADQG